MTKQFEVVHEGKSHRVHEHFVNERVIFAVLFPDGGKVLILTRAKAENNEKFWTSIPEGRYREAEIFGNLIFEKLINS